MKFLVGMYYVKLGRKEISSLSDFFKKFLKYWLHLHEMDKCEGFIADLGQHVVPYPQEVCLSPIHHWIDECCKSTCLLGNEFYVFDNIHDDFLVLNQASMNKKASLYMTFDVSLFWFITKHKGRDFDVNKEFGWLHWLYDYT